MIRLFLIVKSSKDYFIEYVKYIFISFFMLFAPISGILTAVGASIALSTMTGVYKTFKVRGGIRLRGTVLSGVASKMFLYQVCICLLFLMDKYILNDFVKGIVDRDFIFTKTCAILFMFIELVLVKENIETAFKIDIVFLIKSFIKTIRQIFNKIKELK